MRGARIMENDELKVTGITVARLLQLQQAEKDLESLRRRIADCADVKKATEHAFDKRTKYKEANRKAFEKAYGSKEKLTPEEEKELERLENEYMEAIKKPLFTIDGNKAAKLILDHIVYSMSEEEIKQFRFERGIPKTVQVKIT